MIFKAQVQGPGGQGAVPDAPTEVEVVCWTLADNPMSMILFMRRSRLAPTWIVVENVYCSETVRAIKDQHLFLQ